MLHHVKLSLDDSASDWLAPGQYQLAYGLGIEAAWNNGNPGPLPYCGYSIVGHGGLDYGSGAPMNGALTCRPPYCVITCTSCHIAVTSATLLNLHTSRLYSSYIAFC